MLDFELGQTQQQQLPLHQHTKNSVAPGLYSIYLFILSYLFIEYRNLLMMKHLKYLPSDMVLHQTHVYNLCCV